MVDLKNVVDLNTREVFGRYQQVFLICVEENTIINLSATFLFFFACFISTSGNVHNQSVRVGL
jgi:hypothetical protein